MLLHCLSWICRRPWRTGLALCALVGIAGALGMPARRCGLGTEAAMAPRPAVAGGLQGALDRMGYTVNVPAWHDGRSSFPPGGYRTSTRSDAVYTKRFLNDGPVTGRILTDAGTLCGDSSGFSVAGVDRCGTLPPVAPLRSECDVNGPITGPYHGPTVELELFGNDLRFSIYKYPGLRSEGTIPFRSPDNRRGGVIVLPALSGGTWVDEGGNAGHWEGSTRSDGYLVCWEDAEFRPEYQGRIVHVQGVRALRW